MPNLSTITMTRPNALNLAAGIAGSLLIIALFIRNFWALSDLWLMARVAEQFWAGNGLTWNVDERLWVGTSILWQWLLIAARGATWGAEPYVWALLLHSTCLAATLGLIWWRWGWRNGRYVLLTAALLAGSNAFIDYTSGGLENSLVYVAVAAMWTLVMRGARLHWIALVFGLALLVRHDMAVLLGPLAAWSFWQLRGDLRGYLHGRLHLHDEWLRCALLAVAPLLVVTVVYWVYYGSPIPNSFGVKSEGFFSASWLPYWLAMQIIDPWGVVVMLLGALGAVRCGQGAHKALVLGILLYCIYVSMAAAQDLLIGRYVSWCVLAGALLVTEWLARGLKVKGGRRLQAGWMVTGSLVVLMVAYGGLLTTHTPLFPAYSPWDAPGRLYILVDAEDAKRRMDARYWSQNYALPSAWLRGWYGAVSPSYEERSIEAGRRLSETDGDILYPHQLSAPWIVSYYVPLDVVVVDNHHRSPRAGDHGVDVP